MNCNTCKWYKRTCKHKGICILFDNNVKQDDICEDWEE